MIGLCICSGVPSFFFVFQGLVPIGKDQSFLGLKCVACVECAVSKLTNYFCLLPDFFALVDKDRLNPIAVCFDSGGNPEDRGNANKNIENVH